MREVVQAQEILLMALLGLAVVAQLLYLAQLIRVAVAAA
jgi:hypothetical protein